MEVEYRGGDCLPISAPPTSEGGDMIQGHLPPHPPPAGDAEERGFLSAQIRHGSHQPMSLYIP